jgi:hypothetical protein
MFYVTKFETQTFMGLISMCYGILSKHIHLILYK